MLVPRADSSCSACNRWSRACASSVESSQRRSKPGRTKQTLVTKSAFPQPLSPRSAMKLGQVRGAWSDLALQVQRAGFSQSASLLHFARCCPSLALDLLPSAFWLKSKSMKQNWQGAARRQSDLPFASLEFPGRCT